MKVAEQLKKKIVSRAVRNVKRGSAEEESNRGMYRPEIRLDLQRSRFFTESYKETEGQTMVVRRAKALDSLLAKMDIFIRDQLIKNRFNSNVKTRMFYQNPRSLAQWQKRINRFIKIHRPVIC